LAENFEKISSTALLCAKIRAEYTDLPYSSDIYNLAQQYGGREIICSELIQNSSKKAILILEGRYWAMSDAIKRAGFPVIELASGLSSRGLELSDFVYLETDLSAMSLLKKKIIDQLPGTEDKKNYLLGSLNPLNLPQISSLADWFAQKYSGDSASIVNEGLLMYLSDPEQKQLRDNISFVLGNYFQGGGWLTTDFSSRSVENDDLTTKMIMKKIEQETGRKFNRFRNEEQIHDFLSEGGLNGKVLDNLHLVDQISCLKKLDFSESEIHELMRLCQVWEITLK